MDLLAFVTNDWFLNYVALPFLIFFARIIDVSIGTLRLIFVSKGFKNLAPFLGFFEVIIWLLAIKSIMANLSNVFCYIAYGGGFAAGTFVGMKLEEKISIGKVLIRIITKKDASELLETLKLHKYNVTGIEAEGNSCKVKLIFMVVDRCDVNDVISVVKHFNPNAFYSIEEVKFASDDKPGVPKRKWFQVLGAFRKAK